MRDKKGHDDIWAFLLHKMNASIPAALLLVLESDGSSPGRQGFKMAVSLDGDMTGSIGGGIMEHKLVELTITKHAKGDEAASLKRQVHQAESLTDRSGMICSGEQTVVIFPLPEFYLPLVKSISGTILLKKPGIFTISDTGLSFRQGATSAKKIEVNIESKTKWSYQEVISAFDPIHIIGGGHVGSALSRQMAFLGFYVKVYDNRAELNTLADNAFAHEKIITPYDSISDLIPSDPMAFVVIMTFGYRDDKLVLKQLLENEYRYLGMMGSKAKVEQLIAELVDEGYNVKALEKVKTPAGIKIFSKTPAEIAVSIAAEIIRIKNDGQ